jgi:hypothetical protein
MHGFGPAEPPGRLRSLLGITTARYAAGSDALAITDPTPA